MLTRQLQSQTHADTTLTYNSNTTGVNTHIPLTDSYAEGVLGVRANTTDVDAHSITEDVR